MKTNTKGITKLLILDIYRQLKGFLAVTKDLFRTFVSVTQIIQADSVMSNNISDIKTVHLHIKLNVF